MSLLGIERLATAAAQGLASAFAPLAQLTSSNAAFEATLRGAGGGEQTSGAAASPDELAARIQELGESIRSTLERKLASAGIALDAPLELERNAFGQWSVADANNGNRLAIEQALSDLTPDFAERIAEYRRAVAAQEELQGGFGGAFASLVDERDSVRLTVSRDDLVID